MKEKTFFTWAATELKNHEKNNRQALVFLNRNQLFQKEEKLYNRMLSIKITKEERLGLIPAAPVCRK
jgi:hypothetical protein